MGGGASTAVAGVPQGVEVRIQRSDSLAPFRKKSDAAEHYKFAVVQCGMLKDSLHDAAMAMACLKAINEVLSWCLALPLLLVCFGVGKIVLLPS
jgi:hypothetical protein